MFNVLHVKILESSFLVLWELLNFLIKLLLNLKRENLSYTSSHQHHTLHYL